MSNNFTFTPEEVDKRFANYMVENQHLLQDKNIDMEPKYPNIDREAWKRMKFEDHGNIFVQKKSTIDRLFAYKN